MNKRLRKKINDRKVYPNGKIKKKKLNKLYIKLEDMPNRVWVFFYVSGQHVHWGMDKDVAIDVIKEGYIRIGEKKVHRFLMTDLNLMVIANYDWNADITIQGDWAEAEGRYIYLKTKGAYDYDPRVEGFPNGEIYCYSKRLVGETVSINENTYTLTDKQIYDDNTFSVIATSSDQWLYQIDYYVEENLYMDTLKTEIKQLNLNNPERIYKIDQTDEWSREYIYIQPWQDFLNSLKNRYGSIICNDEYILSGIPSIRQRDKGYQFFSTAFKVHDEVTILSIPSPEGNIGDGHPYYKEYRIWWYSSDNLYDREKFKEVEVFLESVSVYRYSYIHKP